MSNAWQRQQRAALQEHELTHAQFVLLATATWFGADEALTQARLAQLAGVDVMTTSQVVRTLEAAGLMQRAPHPDDPRAKLLAVTPSGRAKARKAIVAVERTDAEFFAPTADSAAELLELLQRLNTAHTG